jgi:hypothetical protein
MEKQSVGQKRKLCSGLLILLLVAISFPLFAETLSKAQIRALHVVPQNKIFFTGAECGYTLTLPGIEPSNVQTELPSVPSGVQFLSSKRDEYIGSDGKLGTIVRLWFSFSSAGVYTFDPLSVMIGFRSYGLQFDTVTVYENPKTIMPVLSVRFDNDVSVTDGNVPVVSVAAGQKIHFTLYLKYAVQVVNFSWELPQNSLFTELKRYEITRGEPRGNDFSPNEIPVARFEWEPLVAGHCRLPDVHMTVTAYNGSRREPVLPAYDIFVVEQSSKNAQTSIPSPRENASFAYAFAEQTDSVSEKNLEVSFIDCRNLAQLRSAERHSFPWSPAVEKRRAAETAAGISEGVSEPSVPLFHLLMLLFAVSAAGAAVLFAFRHFYGAVAVTGLTLLFLILSVLYGATLFPHYGIYAGGTISPVPEKNASTEQSAAAGIRVKIVEKAGEWVYIDCTDSGGWVQEKAVFRIR